MKNLKKYLFLLVIFIGFNVMAFGQQQLGVKASGGISRIYGSLEARDLSPSATTTSFSPSIQAGLYYNLPMAKNAAIGAELLYSHVEGGQTHEWDYSGDVSNFTYEQISYLSLPVYVGYTYKRLTINAGFQVSYAISSSGRQESSYKIIEFDENADPIQREESFVRELNDLDIKDFDFGPRAGFIYRLTNRLSMEGMFYYGIRNINQLKSSEEALKIQQMTVGIRYALWSKRKF